MFKRFVEDVQMFFSNNWMRLYRKTWRACRRVEWFYTMGFCIIYQERGHALYEFLKEELANFPEFKGLSMHLRKWEGTHRPEGRLLYWETPLCITVWTEAGPTYGIGVEFWENRLYIRQLQGVDGVRLPRSMRLLPLFLVQSCMTFARARVLGLRLYRASWSFNYHFPSAKPNTVMPIAEYRAFKKGVRERMRRRYDGTAREAGLIPKLFWFEQKPY